MIVATDFELKINELEGIDTYKSVRGEGSMRINATARVARLEDGYAIVLSPYLFTEFNDNQTRYFVVSHEFHHLVNKRDFPTIPKKTYLNDMYLHHLYDLYDEYSSDRFAYSRTDEEFVEKSPLWILSVKTDADRFINLITDPHYYSGIQDAIRAVKQDAKLDFFFKKISHYYDEIAIPLVHLWALLHHYPDRFSELDLLKSPFVNNKTIALMEYYKYKIEHQSNNLFDGVDLITDFMTNFGVKFERRDNEDHCHVIDI